MAEQTELVAGIAAGTARLAVKGDAGGSSYQAFALCTGAETPAADGCVAAERLDAAGLPLAPESTEIPAAIRFTGVTGSFSTWALVHTERALAAALVATIDEPITLSSPQPVAVVVHGSAAVDVSQVGAASLRFGVGQVAALSSTIVPGGDPYPDLLASFPVAGSGVALGDTEACLSGLVGGEAFVACDGVLVRLHGRRCGLGFELALALPLLARLRRRRFGRG